jgi:hypothetical protein
MPLNVGLLSSIAEQMMKNSRVEIEGKPVPVRRTSSQRLRTLAFAMNGREYQAIKQS